MIAQMTPSEKAQARETARKAAPRPIGIQSLTDIMAAGGSIRRGTVLRNWRPIYEWQAFDANGEFVAPVVWTATRGFQVSDQPGINR